MPSLKKKILGSLIGLSLAPSIYAACSYGSFSSFDTSNLTPLYLQYKAMISLGLTGGNIQVALQKKQMSINARISSLEQTILAKMTLSDAAFVSNMRAFSDKIVDQIERTGSSLLQANTTLASFEEKEDIKHQINELASKLEQPATNCLSLSAGKSFPNTIKSIRYETAQKAKVFGSSVANSVQSSTSWKKQEYDRNKDLFRNDNSQLKDGDVQSSVLFGSADGGLTRSKDIENNALSSVISYLTGLAYVPKAVGDNQDNSAAGRNFALLQRRNAAFTSLSQYVLDYIASKSAARTDLAPFFESAKLTMNPTQKAYGVSMNEVMDLYVKKLMSKENITTLAQTTSEVPLLRSILMNDSMALWMDVQKLNSQLQSEMMKAAELSLLTQEILGEKAMYYRQDAINRTGFKQESK